MLPHRNPNVAPHRPSGARRFFVGALLAFATLHSFSAPAHPLDLALLRLREERGVLRVRLEMNPTAAAALGRSITLATILTERVPEIGGVPCVWNEPSAPRLESEQLISVEADLTCSRSTGAFRYDTPFVARIGGEYRMLYMAELGAGEHVGDATPATPSVRFEIAHSERSFGSFVAMGLGHVGVDPREWHDDRGFHVPKGIDHLLFVVSLVFGGAAFLPLVRTITGFTIGHTISLALASYGVVRFSGRWIEALIALTIVGIAGMTVIRPNAKGMHRWRIAIGIGLIHGLGFAAALTGLRLSPGALAGSVVGFNLGVELGQCAVIALTYVLIRQLRRMLRDRPLAFERTVRSLSFVILVVALGWFVARVPH